MKTSSRLAVWTFSQTYKVLMVWYTAPVFQGIIYAALAGPWHGFTVPGSSWKNVIAPYGIPWFLFYGMLSVPRDYSLFMSCLIVFDCILSFLIYQKTSSRFYLLYYPSSFFLLYLAPGDVVIAWLGGLSRLRWHFSGLAVITKFPVGAPLWVWQFIASVSLAPDNSLQWFNLIRYPLLLFWMIWPLESKLFYALTKRLGHHHGSSDNNNIGTDRG